MKISEKLWTKFYIDKSQKNYPLWPIEAMVKVIFGDYLVGKKPTLGKGVKVLDVGCGFGNNLIPFLMVECECSGVEITNEMVLLSQQNLSDRGFKKVKIKKGNNRSLPYTSDSFDLLISNNVIHYENSEKNYLEALKEYKRVLKPGGALYLTTVGSKHDIYKNAKVEDAHSFKIKNWDFRDGETYFYVSNQKYLKYYLKKYFEGIETGRVTEKLMTTNLDFFIAFCRK